MSALLARWVERTLAEHDPPLTVAQWSALRAIAGGPVSAAELARRAAVSPPAVSQLVRGLVDTGLVEARPAADDARRRELRLSRAGTRTTRAAESLLAARLGPLLAGLPHPEVDALRRALPLLEAALTGTPPPPRPRPPGPPPPRPHHPRPPGRT